MCYALEGRQFAFTHSKTLDGGVTSHETTASSQQNWKILNKQEHPYNDCIDKDNFLQFG